MRRFSGGMWAATSLWWLYLAVDSDQTGGGFWATLVYFMGAALAAGVAAVVLGPRDAR
jgi:hypothetical protein